MNRVVRKYVFFVLLQILFSYLRSFLHANGICAFNRMNITTSLVECMARLLLLMQQMTAAFYHLKTKFNLLFLFKNKNFVKYT